MPGGREPLSRPGWEFRITWNGRPLPVRHRALSLLSPSKTSWKSYLAFSRAPKSWRTAPTARLRHPPVLLWEGYLNGRPRPRPHTPRARSSLLPLGLMAAAGSGHGPARPLLLARALGTPFAQPGCPRLAFEGAQVAFAGCVWVVRVLDVPCIPYRVTLTLWSGGGAVPLRPLVKPYPGCPLPVTAASRRSHQTYPRKERATSTGSAGAAVRGCIVPVALSRWQKGVPGLRASDRARAGRALALAAEAGSSAAALPGAQELLSGRP